jgi:hypothetical protein
MNGPAQTFTPSGKFTWQSGYGPFTVSVTISKIRWSIIGRSFQEEDVSFLKKHGIGFEERYLWN